MSSTKRTRRQPGPTPGSWPVRFGTAALLADDDLSDGWLLEVDGIPQSYIRAGDPEYLEFEYVQRIADVIDLTAEPGAPITVLHLGGGGCTLPRYVAATRPGSTQLVIEADAPLADLVRSQFGTEGFKLRVGDAREALAGLRKGESDVVVSDVFAGADLPVSCTTAEFIEQVKALLRPGGTYVANLADGPPFGFARGQVATVQTQFAHVVLQAEPAVLRGRRFGNLVLAGSDEPFDVPALSRLAARAAGRARVLTGEDARAFAGQSKPVTDASAAQAPIPPAGVFQRRAESPT